MSYRAGFIGLIGQPNAGKSSLMNFIVREKVSIVSSKPQTTRRRILGILSLEEAQVVFVDAPGVIAADKGLNGFLAMESQDVIRDSDALLAILSVDEDKAENAAAVLEMVKASKKPWKAIITKTDIIEKSHRIRILRKMVEDAGGVALLSTTVDKSFGKEDQGALISEIVDLLPESPAPLFDVDLFTNEPVREMATEIIREACFESLYKELPYSVAVRLIQFDELAKPVPKIYAEIMVSKENHKSIVIGEGGKIIKAIGTKARIEIEKMMGEKVFLDLKVNFKENWFTNTRIMKELGYVTKRSE